MSRSDGSAPFKTKCTLGLLTIDWTSQNDPQEDEKSPEILAEEQAARDAIQAKRSNKKKKKTRQKSRSQSPTKDEVLAKIKADALAAVERQARQEEETMRRKAQEIEEARRKALEEEEERRRANEEEARRRKAEEARRRRQAQEEEEARRRAAEEAEQARLKAAEEEARRRKAAAEEEEEAAAQAKRLKAEEDAFLQAMAEEEAARRRASELALLAAATRDVETPPRPPRQQQRRASMFPCTRDNVGLVQAVKKYRYGEHVPFDWEKPEWTMKFGTLKHTTTQKSHYYWETPEWVTKSILKKTEWGAAVKQGKNLEKPIVFKRRHSFSDNQSLALEKPSWMKRFRLKQTQAGAAVRSGANLSLPISNIRSFLEHSHNFDASSTNYDESHTGGGSFQFFEDSYASVLSNKNITWERPDWAVDPSLRPTQAGNAARQGFNLALPVANIHKVIHNEASEEDLGSSFGALNVSSKNLAWEKPSWALNPGLKRTSKGELMRQKGNLARPVTFPKGGSTSIEGIGEEQEHDHEQEDEYDHEQDQLY